MLIWCMNDDIRSAVTARLEERGMSRADLARVLSRTPEEITRALNNTGGRGGSAPPLWIAILAALDLELTAQPKEQAGNEK